MLPQLAEARRAMREFMRSWEQGLKDINQWDACCDIERRLLDVEIGIITHSTPKEEKRGRAAFDKLS
jgi:hypothetical protein